jgi:hypothetical protein
VLFLFFQLLLSFTGVKAGQWAGNGLKLYLLVSHPSRGSWLLGKDKIQPRLLRHYKHTDKGQTSSIPSQGRHPSFLPSPNFHHGKNHDVH